MTKEEKLKWVRRYSALASANVADAMDNLDIPCRVPAGVWPLNPGQPRTAGFAVTMEQKPRGTPFDGKGLARQAAVIDENLGEGDLLVISAADVRICCTGGGLQAMCMKKKGVSGLLTDGSLRDLDEIAEMGFPAFLSSASPLKSTRYIETAGVNIPVTVGGVRVNPGDLVLMDRSGVLIIPPEKLEEIAGEAERITAEEDRVMENIKAGMSFAAAKKAAEQ